jgi:hypothetical protein
MAYRTWTASDPTWASLNPTQKAVAMALMEADGRNPADARNVLGAIINRAQMTGEDLGSHVSRAIYQPTIEPTQQARLRSILADPSFSQLSGWAERRLQGQEADPVQGATHFLAPEKTMLALEAREPNKYKSWRQWTGFDPSKGEYRGVLLRDGSHAFLSPDGTPKPTKPNTTPSGGGYGVDPDGAYGVAGAIQTPDAGDAGITLPKTETPAGGALTGSQQGMGLLADTFNANESPGMGDVFKAVLGGLGAAAGDFKLPEAPRMQLQMAQAQAPKVDLSGLTQAVRKRRWGV